jgi:hypothetical protein
VPDSELALRLASASWRADGAPSAAKTVSELGAAPIAFGARSSWTVVATAAAPIGTTDNVWSSMFAVTAYSPASGSGECSPNACWRGSGVGIGPVACCGTLVAAAVGLGIGVGWTAGVATAPGPLGLLHAAPKARDKASRASGAPTRVDRRRSCIRAVARARPMPKRSSIPWTEAEHRLR